jgi:hypothetical protein
VVHPWCSSNSQPRFAIFAAPHSWEHDQFLGTTEDVSLSGSVRHLSAEAGDWSVRKTCQPRMNFLHRGLRVRLRITAGKTCERLLNRTCQIAAKIMQSVEE